MVKTIWNGVTEANKGHVADGVTAEMLSGWLKENYQQVEKIMNQPPPAALQKASEELAEKMQAMHQGPGGPGGPGGPDGPNGPP
jgi:hypothetical protein